MLVLFLFAAGMAGIALAAVPSVLLPASIGERVHYRLVRTIQGPSGPLATTVNFDLVRKAATTLVLDRASPNGGPPDLSVLKINADGSLALSEDPRAAALDGDLGDLLAGLNLAIAATHDSDAAAHGTWYAALDVGSGTTIPVVVVPANVAGADFDFTGNGQGSLAPPTPAAHDEPAGGMGGGGMGGHGGMGGGGMPGGGYPGGGMPGGFPGGGHHGRGEGGPPGDAPSRNTAVTLNVHIDGHSSAGRISRISIAETRSVTLAGLPYTNQSSWQISAVSESPRRQMGTSTTP